MLAAVKPYCDICGTEDVPLYDTGNEATSNEEDEQACARCLRDDDDDAPESADEIDLEGYHLLGCPIWDPSVPFVMPGGGITPEQRERLARHDLAKMRERLGLSP